MSAESETGPKDSAGNQAKETDEQRSIFHSALNELAEVGGFSNTVSLLLQGETTSRSGTLASMVHGQMCAHARSTGALAISSMFDHSAIMALGRMLIDGMTVYAYLTEPVTPDIWELRYDVMRLHETAARIKLVRAWRNEAEYADLKTERDALIHRMRKNAVFQGFDEKQQTRLSSGEEMFVGGMRRAARTAGWSEEMFVSIYNYFSAHIHSTPMSYWRAREHAIDYYAPSAMQFASATMAVGIGIACLRRVTLGQIKDTARLIPETSGEYLEKLRKDDTECTMFGIVTSGNNNPESQE